MKKNSKNSGIVLLSEAERLKKCQQLGEDVGNAENDFVISVGTSIKQASQIGRIAKEAKVCIEGFPTKAQKKTLTTDESDLAEYKKPTFVNWIRTYTTLSKDTIYSMIKFHEYLEENPNFKLDNNKSWRDVLGLFNKQSSLKEAKVDTLDVDAEEIEDEEIEDEEIENEKSNRGQGVKKDNLNKLRDKVNKLFEKFLKNPENSEYKELIMLWQESIAD